jgi:hypothetical protein
MEEEEEAWGFTEPHLSVIEQQRQVPRARRGLASVSSEGVSRLRRRRLRRLARNTGNT